MAASAVSYDDAQYIRVAERDVKLAVDARRWPTRTLTGWRRNGHALRRTIAADPMRLPVPLEELILRFPAAPLDALQRLHLHHRTLDVPESFHTLRVLRSAQPHRAKRPVKRIFLMHTGLNERGRMGLYYRLASQLVKQEPRTVCIVRPFPGHMTRFPFAGPAETPMDHYLWDGSHLFRQFLRFMIETQWLLSAIVRRSSYRCASGANLLAEKDAVEGSRLDGKALAAAIHGAWVALAAASNETARREHAAEQAARPAAAGPDDGDLADAWEPARREPTEEQIEEAIATVREALHLTELPQRGGDLDADEEWTEPDIHVLGYSLGGFTAQSVFMSWPFLVTSCSSVLAGGALRELAPTGFTDPEEWQTVLHSLRYELDDRLMSRDVAVDGNAVAGVERDLFTYFKRTFYEVFQQDYRGSIQTRLEAFRDRMLFIVGGDDPVVRPETVLQSGPKGGVNLLEIGGLGHFIDDKRDGEGERQTFWLPEMAALIHRFADSAAEEQRRLRPYIWFDERFEQPARTRKQWNEVFDKDSATKRGHVGVRRLTAAEQVEIKHDGALSGEIFQRCLDDLLARAQSTTEGVLFVLRNELPTALVHDAAVRETAAALCHDDFGIVRYCHGVAARREQIANAIPRICLVLPWNARTIARKMDLVRAYPSQAEGAGGHVSDRHRPNNVWEMSLANCYALARKKGGAHSIRRFDGNRQLPATRPGDDGSWERLVGLAERFVGDELMVPSLPDCWIWIGRSLLVASDSDEKLTVQTGISGLIRQAPRLYDSQPEIVRAIQKETIRIIDVSHARYNPRFRGRLLLDPRTAQRRLAHAALCAAMSEPIVDTRTGRALEAEPFA